MDGSPGSGELDHPGVLRRERHAWRDQALPSPRLRTPSHPAVRRRPVRDGGPSLRGPAGMVDRAGMTAAKNHARGLRVTAPNRSSSLPRFQGCMLLASGGSVPHTCEGREKAAVPLAWWKRSCPNALDQGDVAQQVRAPDCRSGVAGSSPASARTVGPVPPAYRTANSPQGSWPCATSTRRQHKGPCTGQIKGETPQGPHGPSHRALTIALLTD